MTDEWDVDDYLDFKDFQDEAKADERAEALVDLATEEDYESSTYLCADCGFYWNANWRPHYEPVRKKLEADPAACPRCGSHKKGRKR